MSEYHYHNTPARLAAWRQCSYRKPEEKLPPGYFGALSPASVNREPLDEHGKPRTPTFNYGDGLGGRTERPEHAGRYRPVPNPVRFGAFALGLVATSNPYRLAP